MKKMMVLMICSLFITLSAYAEGGDGETAVAPSGGATLCKEGEGKVPGGPTAEGKKKAAAGDASDVAEE